MKILKQWKEHPSILEAEGEPVDWFETTEKEFLDHTEGCGYIEYGLGLDTLKQGVEINTHFAMYKKGEEKQMDDKEIKANEIRDFQATTDFWDWARKQNKLTSKLDWPGYERICFLKGKCAFCQYFEGCKDCFLNRKLEKCIRINGCDDGEAVFDQYASPVTYSETRKVQINLQRKAANKIYKVCAKYLKILKFKGWGKKMLQTK